MLRHRFAATFGGSFAQGSSKSQSYNIMSKSIQDEEKPIYPPLLVYHSPKCTENANCSVFQGGTNREGGSFLYLDRQKY